MRRSALFGLSLLLGGCQFVGNPFDGGGRFLYDTETFHSNPNLPPGVDETELRVEEKDVTIAPLLPEPGDVWPGPMKPLPTMQDQLQNKMQPLPPPNVPTAPPPLLFPETPTGPQGSSSPPGPQGASSQQAPQGGSSADQGVLIPNGDGTSTLIGPDGSIRTVPTPK